MIESSTAREAQFKRLREWAWDHPLTGQSQAEAVLPEKAFVYLNQNAIRIAMSLNR